jgi:sugar phosphate isomerase/epimerase
MVKYKISSFIDEYSDDLEEQVVALKRYGIEFVELRHCDGKNVADFEMSDVLKIKKAFDDANIKVSSIGSPLGKISIDGDIEQHLKLAEKLFAMANIFNAKYVRVFSFYIPKGHEAAEYRNEVLSAMQKLIDLADKCNVVLCHENEAGIYGESPENCLDLLNTFNGKLKCVFDMGNFVLDGHEPYPHAFEMLKDKIAYFHIKDALYEGAIVPAGKGEASIKEILSTYSKNNEGEAFVTIEPHLQTFAGLNALVGKTFENPYKYENQRVAFDDDVNKFKELLRG